MFQIIWSCISQLWELLCESISSTNNSQPPSSSPSDSIPSITNSQDPSSSVSESMASQVPSSSVPDSLPSTTISQTPSSSTSESMASTTISQTQLPFVSSSTPTRYDVFLSFRGEDTRLTFTGHLYDKLESNGIRTFRDDPDLRMGDVISDELLDGIRKSKTYIAVISENYASSSWCLDELAEILNCHKAAERLVIPVFYKIDPAVVRHKTGSFEHAFKKHQDRFEMEKVNNWRFTLTEVAGFSGRHISENRSEADVINEIVHDLLLEINPKTLDVTKYPVGLDSRVKSITTLLSSETKGVIKFGIYGMGGVGKTTLAKALFNQLVRGGRFKGSCFLANVRENSGTEKGLVSLQMQLINDVLNSKTKVEVHNVDQGIQCIRHRICSAKILVVIDDIYDLKQYEFLAGPFASGSVIIITTRDEEMLDKVSVEPKYRYMLKELEDAQSRELFIKHAFGKAEPPKNLLALSDDILGLAGGLPLALQVFGSHLSTKKEVGWKSYINTLQQHPNSNIEQKLAISLDALGSDDPMLKKMFIDIACFFIGWKKKEAVEVLDTYYDYPDDKMETLTKRCLLTLNYSDELEMHDLLRDVGRNVARNNAPNEPGKYSRLWLPEDIENVLKNHKGTEAIEGIIPYNLYFHHSEGESFSTETFKWMRNLRFLYFMEVNLIGSFQQMFEDLRVLCWNSCPLKCLPSDFYPEKLVILELRRSNMRTMWDLNMESHVFGKLKTVDMKFSEYLITTPDFTKLPCLETLDLSFCKSLETVHVSIGSLGKLVSLNLERCEKLRSLPDTICHLRALQVLTISWCLSLEALPIQLGNIKSLTKLNAVGLTVSKLPDSIGNLTKLVELNLWYNKKLETLPDSICNLTSLEILDISSCSSLEALPIQLGNIKSLTKLNAHGLTISKLPDSIGHLNELLELNVRNNKKLETLPDTICNLRSLEILNISSCWKLKTLPDELWKITSLRELHADGLSLLKKLPDIGPSQIALSLQKLNLYGSGITALPSGFSRLSNLEELPLCGCKHLLSIPELPPNLKVIWADYCTSLERIPNLSNLKHLEKLVLTHCWGLTEIQGLEKLSALKELDLTDCRGLTDIQGLEELTSITQLHLKGLSDSLVAYNLTKRLFQAYSDFGRLIIVDVTEFRNWEIERDWITESPYWTSESSGSTKESTTMYAHLLPNESHNFMAIILCFTSQRGLYKSLISYSVKNTTSGFIWSNICVPSEGKSLMVIVPKSIFSVRDDDCRIELTADTFTVKSLGIHLLYNTETEMIEDIAEKHVIDHIDALKSVDPVLQAIFLDIACFFIHWKEEEVVRILKTYYSKVDQNIDILKKRCLLTTNFQDELEMNDLLRHVGTKIARNNSPDDPRTHSTLWLSSDIYDVLKKQEGTEVIEGIVPRKVYNEDALNGESFTLETFKKMRRLRFLCLKKVHLTGSFEQTFEDLRWLCWDYCPLKCLPSDFYPPKLVILELRRSTIITMWELNMVPHVFEKLKTLDMSYSEDLTTTPDFTKLPCLETLSLKGCESLEEVHISIGSLVRLVSLDLHGCVKLRSLPDTICNLRSLEILDIDRCSSLEALPSAIGNIESLKKISVRKLIVSKLPDSIGRLTKLVELDLSNNKKLVTLPDTICNLRSLEILDISWCGKLEILPDQLWKLTRLRELNAGRDTLLKKLPDIGPSQIALSLQELNLSWSGITALPSGLNQLSNLQSLQLSNCNHLLSFPELPPNLRRIRASACVSLERLPNLSNLKDLETLDLESCWRMKEILGLEKLTGLRELHLRCCRGLTYIQGLEELTSITFLQLGRLSGSLVAYNLTKRLFQVYSEFGRSIIVHVPEYINGKIPNERDWISESLYWTSESTKESTTMYAHLLPNESHNFMGIILCFKRRKEDWEEDWEEDSEEDLEEDSEEDLEEDLEEDSEKYTFGYSVKNTTSGFIWSDSLEIPFSELLMVIVPKSIFSVTDDDHRIVLTADNSVKIVGIHLLYVAKKTCN